MRNDITYSKSGLLVEAGSVANGATLHGAAIQLKPGTAVAITDAASLAQEAQEDVEEARVELREDYVTLALVILQIHGFARLLREFMRKVLGPKHSAAWILLGFPENLEMPRSAGAVETMIFKMWKFLLTNPEHEVPAKNITAAEAEILYNKISESRQKAEAQDAKVTVLQQDCDNKFAALRKKLRDVCNELKSLIGPLDGRWKAFGFNMPGAQAIADVPANVIAVLIGNNAVSVKWDAAARAEHYRVWKRVIGVDDEFTAVGSPADRDFTIEGLPSAKEVEIAVSAVNNGGESQKSAVQKVTTL